MLHPAGASQKTNKYFPKAKIWVCATRIPVFPFQDPEQEIVFARSRDHANGDKKNAMQKKKKP